MEYVIDGNVNNLKSQWPGIGLVGSILIHEDGGALAAMNPYTQSGGHVYTNPKLLIGTGSIVDMGNNSVVLKTKSGLMEISGIDFQLSDAESYRNMIFNKEYVK